MLFTMIMVISLHKISSLNLKKKQISLMMFICGKKEHHIRHLKGLFSHHLNIYYWEFRK